MTEQDIADVIAAYARSAVRARDAGFDGIAIHGAHGYLIDTFFWAETNQRTDRWGGAVANRTRFGAEVVRAIRAAIGPELPIFFRFSQWKQQDFRARLATTPQELEQLLGPIADAGVDVFDGSVRYFDRAEFEGSPLNLSGWAKKLTGKLAMAVGGIGLDRGMYDSNRDWQGRGDRQHHAADGALQPRRVRPRRGRSLAAQRPGVDAQAATRRGTAAVRPVASSRHCIESREIAA